MGAVYLAEHPVMGRKAAVKFLRRELAEDKTLVARFINEARAANAIRHPNIIDIIDVGTLSGTDVPYMMMEFLDGESLAGRIARLGRLSPAEAVAIALQTAAALGAVHAKGIVHRDLKPDNLFIIPDDVNPGRERVKVLDFGIAKLRGQIDSGSVKTHAGSIMGTPPYMSPEQCRGIQDDIDHRTDIYALGIILFEMLCGTAPFVSAGYGEVLVMHLTKPPPSPRQSNPGVPEHLEQAILKALAKTRQERFASMAELQAALVRAPNHTVNSEARAKIGAAETLAPPPDGGAVGVVTEPPGAMQSRPRIPVLTPAVADARRSGPSAGTTTFSSNTGQVAIIASEPARRSLSHRRALIGGAAGAAAAVALTAVLVSKTKAPPMVARPEQTGVAAAGGKPAGPKVALVAPAGESGASAPTAATAPTTTPTAPGSAAPGAGAAAAEVKPIPDPRSSGRRRGRATPAAIAAKPPGLAPDLLRVAAPPAAVLPVAAPATAAATPAARPSPAAGKKKGAEKW